MPSRAAAIAEPTPSSEETSAQGSSLGAGTASDTGSTLLGRSARSRLTVAMEQRPRPLSAAPRDRALSFASVADAYDRSRPSYPREAAEWLTGRVPSTVVELG